MTPEEWAKVTSLINWMRNNDIYEAEVKAETFEATVIADPDGFNLEVDRVNVNGG